MIDISNTNTKIDIEIFKNMIKRYEEYKKEKNVEPPIIYVTCAKNTYVTLERFKDMLQRYNEFKAKNKREPAYVAVNKEDNIFDLYKVVYLQIEKQDTGYTCGPSSLLMMLRELAQSALPQYSEALVAKLAGTTKSGTGHDGLCRAAKKLGSGLGWNITCKEYNMSMTSWKQLGEWIADPNIGVVAHVLTGDLPHWRGDYGHYVFPIGVNLERRMVTIADPGRGVPDVYKATFQQFSRACIRVTWAPSLLLFIKN